MRFFLLILVLISAQVVWSSDFHTFTSNNGKTVKAKIVKANPVDTKVELERENGKRFYVDWNIFTSEDQAYILNWIKNPAKLNTTASRPEPSNTHPRDPLTSKEVKALVKEYGSALKNNDYKAYSQLCQNPFDKNQFSTFEIQSFKVKKCDHNNARVEFKIKYLSGDDLIKGKTVVRSGWVQIAPNGKVKYEPTYTFNGGQHPMLRAISSLSSLFYYHESIEERINQIQIKRITKILDDFNNWGIPCYGYKQDLSKREREKSLEKILDWMEDNYKDWDATTPKIPCPKDAFKEGIKELESLRK